MTSLLKLNPQYACLDCALLLFGYGTSVIVSPFPRVHRQQSGPSDQPVPAGLLLPPKQKAMMWNHDKETDE